MFVSRRSRFPRAFTICFLLSGFVRLFLVSSAATTNLRGRNLGGATNQTTTSTTIQCRITLVHTLSRLENEDADESFSNTVCIPLIGGEEGHEAFAYDIDLPDSISSQHWDLIEEGLLHLTITQASFQGDFISTTENSQFTVIEQGSFRRRHLNNKPFNQTKGRRSLAIITVSTTAGQRVSYSQDMLRKRLFEEPRGMADQYSKCSLGLLEWEFAGFYPTVVEGSITDYESPSHARNMALQNIVDSGIVESSAQELADNVMVILPNGTPGLIANAGVNYWLSTLNDVWSLDLLTVIHELAHNLGLGHAGYGASKYGDFSSYMSSTARSPQLESPLRCFNGAENDQLGWFRHRDRSTTVKPRRTPNTVAIAAFSQWTATEKSLPILVNVDNCAFLLYNRADGFNRDTKLFEDSVTVARNIEGSTLILGGLRPGEEALEIESCTGSGANFWIQACGQVSGDMSNAPDFMIIAYGLDENLCDGNAAILPPETIKATTTATTTTTTKPTTTTTSTTTSPVIETKSKQGYGVINMGQQNTLSSSSSNNTPGRRHFGSSNNVNLFDGENLVREQPTESEAQARDEGGASDARMYRNKPVPDKIPEGTTTTITTATTNPVECPPSEGLVVMVQYNSEATNMRCDQISTSKDRMQFCTQRNQRSSDPSERVFQVCVRECLDKCSKK